tara:strand:- start:3234 stop:4547 length:1314 start_codon:yes stop_codon:yes gene_type:complete
MANPNIDSDFSRGYYQHRRTYSSNVNGDGRPVAGDILEGEIAINLTTEKLYTKKNAFTAVDYAATLNKLVTKAGILLTVTPIPTSYIGQRIGVNFNNGTKSFYTIDSDDASTLTNFITGLATHISNNHSEISVVNGTALGTFGKDTQILIFNNDSDNSMSYDLDSDFVRYIDHNLTNVTRYIQDDADDTDIFTDSGTVNANSYIQTYKTVGSVKSVTSSGRPVYKDVSKSNNSYYITNLLVTSGGFNEGTDKFRASIDSNTAVILDLSQSVPSVSNTPPVVSTESGSGGNSGDLWIQPPGIQNDSEPSFLYWLDLSIVNSTRAQNKARSMNDSDRTSNGVVLYDSDGAGNERYGEWRQIQSNSYLITRNLGTTSVIQTFDSDSIHIFEGEFNIKDGTLRAGSRFEFQNEMFTKTKRLRIKDVNGATQFSMFGFDSDG